MQVCICKCKINHNIAKQRYKFTMQKQNRVLLSALAVVATKQPRKLLRPTKTLCYYDFKVIHMTFFA